MLIIIDCGQGRGSLNKRKEFGASTLSAVMQELSLKERPALRAICMSSSFPNPPKDKLDECQAYEWNIWQDVREVGPVMFGDYAAMYRLKKSSTYVPGDWRASVVFPLDNAWLTYRDPNANDQSGWTEGAQQIMQHPNYFDPGPVWGANRIASAAEGDLTDLNSSRYWHAVKVNLHIHHQLSVAAETIANFGIDEEN